MNHPLRAAVGRVGLASRGVVYLLVGLMALLLAVRGHGKSADQKGALTELAGQPFGRFLVMLVAVGVAAYALWQLSQAAFRVVGEPDEKGTRVRCLASGLLYAGLTCTAVSVLAGARKSQGAQQAGLTAKVMGHAGGRWLVGLVGLVVLGIGIGLALQGGQAQFLRRMEGLSGKRRETVKRLGQVGSLARGVVVGLAGVLVVSAAWTFDPAKARGIDGALRTLLHQPFGRVLVLLAAVGLLVFGVFGLIEAKYRKV